MTVTSEQLDAWRGHIGRSETREALIDLETLRRFAAAVGADLDVESHLPPLAHWAFFLETVAQTGLGPDGHPLRGAGLLPPVSLPRRMFAAATLHLAAPLIPGRPAQLTQTVAEVTHKSGKAGDLVFVEVERALSQDGRDCVSERQTLVYRAAGPPLVPIQPVEIVPRAAETVWQPGPADLFRFSAATFNAHRIHYDLPYAREVEGYPGLVVQGPFTAARLYGLATADLPAATPRTFSFRALAPLFADQPVRLAEGPGPGDWSAIRCDGVVAMTARLTV